MAKNWVGKKKQMPDRNLGEPASEYWHIDLVELVFGM